VYILCVNIVKTSVIHVYNDWIYFTLFSVAYVNRTEGNGEGVGSYASGLLISCGHRKKKKILKKEDEHRVGKRGMRKENENWHLTRDNRCDFV